MKLIIAILILLLALTFIWNVFSKNNYNKAISCFCVIIMLTVALINDSSKDEPTAMDVYQGKTTLEVTYRDSIPVDSVVVYKKDNATNLNIY